MKTLLLSITAALALGLAGCDRGSDGRAMPQGSAGSSSGAGSSGSAGAGTTGAPSQSNTPSTPANIGQPQSQAEKREGANPQQQQVDPKQAEQRRDFQMKGDGAGPKPGG